VLFAPGGLLGLRRAVRGRARGEAA
jgi:hypothetical protein